MYLVRHGATLNNLAGNLWENGDYGTARDLFQRSLKVRLKLLGQDHPSVAVVQKNLGSVYTELGNYAIATNCWMNR